MKRLAFFLMIMPMTAVSSADPLQGPAGRGLVPEEARDELSAKLAASQEAAQKISLDLKATADQLASAQTSNKTCSRPSTRRRAS